MPNYEEQKKVARIVAHAWQDPDFKARLLKDPASVLSEHGLLPPEGVAIHMHENTSKDIHFVLPAKPAELRAEDLYQESRLMALASMFEPCLRPRV